MGWMTLILLEGGQGQFGNWQMTPWLEPTKCVVSSVDFQQANIRQ